MNSALYCSQNFLQIGMPRATRSTWVDDHWLFGVNKLDDDTGLDNAKLTITMNRHIWCTGDEITRWQDDWVRCIVEKWSSIICCVHTGQGDTREYESIVNEVRVSHLLDGALEPMHLHDRGLYTNVVKSNSCRKSFRFNNTMSRCSLQ